MGSCCALVMYMSRHGKLVCNECRQEVEQEERKGTDSGRHLMNYRCSRCGKELFCNWGERARVESAEGGTLIECRM